MIHLYEIKVKSRPLTGDSFYITNEGTVSVTSEI